MAAKTPPKKIAPKNTAAKKSAPKQQSPEELRTGLATKQADLLEYRRSLAAGELVNPRVIAATRKDIARLKTALTAVEQTGKGEK